MNPTHDPALRSWVESANDSSEFPIQNLPFAVFKRRDSQESPRVGVAIGDFILDVSAANRANVFEADEQRAAAACGKPTMNALMALGPEHWSALRVRLCDLFDAVHPDVDQNRAACEPCLVPMSDAELRLPCDIGDYTNFYASAHHVAGAGGMFPPDTPLPHNYKYLPVAYHGRASSIVLSGTPVRRPFGQTLADGATAPEFGPCHRLDYELGVGFFVGPGNALGKTIPIGEARDHIFGLCIVNDWSARDIQKWEQQPLGPFLARSFATTISPWVVTMEALEPFRVPAFERDAGDPRPLSYLYDKEDQKRGGIDITVEVYIESLQMRERGIEPLRVSRGNFKDMYWTVAQLLAHNASNGCNLRPGDLVASGTVSGREDDSRGCLVELASRGAGPVRLPTGEERKFLFDGDEVMIRAFCRREGAATIGFGECLGTVVAALGG